jgi:alpha,alpha-trehalose phosphorylase
MLVRGRRLSVEATKTHATYTLLAGEPLELGHHGKAITVSTDRPAKKPIPPVVSGPPPSQPKGRAPARREDTDN